MSDHRTVRYSLGEALLALYRARGPVVKLGVGPVGYTALFGPDANKFVFASADAFSWAETFQSLLLADGPRSLILSDGPDYRRRHSAVAPALHRRRVDDYHDTIVATVDAVLDGWRAGQRVDVYAEFRRGLCRTITASLFGPRIALHADIVGELLEPLLAMEHLPPEIMALRRRTNSPAWRVASANRARIDALVDGWIAEARNAPTPDYGLLSDLVARSEDAALNDLEIRDLVLSQISDGFETTSAATGWAIHSLLTVPGVWAAARAEVDRVLGDRRPAATDISALGYLHGVVQETLRLYTPGALSARKVIADITFDGTRIPAGRFVLFSPYVTHRMPEIWPDPLTFRPQRWDPAAPGYRRPLPQEFIPFSGGLHRCIGSTMAVTTMTVILARLAARTELRLPAQRIRARHYGAVRPWPGLAVDITRVRAA